MGKEYFWYLLYYSRVPVSHAEGPAFNAYNLQLNRSDSRWCESPLMENLDSHCQSYQAMKNLTDERSDSEQSMLDIRLSTHIHTIKQKRLLQSVYYDYTWEHAFFPTPVQGECHVWSSRQKLPVWTAISATSRINYSSIHQCKRFKMLQIAPSHQGCNKAKQIGSLQASYWGSYTLSFRVSLTSLNARIGSNVQDLQKSPKLHHYFVQGCLSSSPWISQLQMLALIFGIAPMH